jgi:hypothetical protein
MSDKFRGASATGRVPREVESLEAYVSRTYGRADAESHVGSADNE